MKFVLPTSLLFQISSLVLLFYVFPSRASAQPGPNLYDLTLVEASQGIKEGQIQSVALVEQLLHRIDEYRFLNAFISVDGEGALAAAARIDAERERGGNLGRLAGVPLVIKDNINTSNLPTTGGTPSLANFRPASDAPIVRRLVAAGAIILGKTNLHELAIGVTSANAHFGEVKNAYSTNHFPGGSSGGTGSAIGARLAPGGLGTDTGGSVRIPSALNGIAGLRPTIGRYPASGMITLSRTRDTAGPMARTVGDVILLDSVITGYDQPIAPYELHSLRLGVPVSFWTDLETETREVSEALLDDLRSQGVTLVDISLDGFFEFDEVISPPLTRYEIRRDLSRFLEEYGTGLSLTALVRRVASADVKTSLETRILGENAPSEAEYRHSIEVDLPALQALYRKAFAVYAVDALIFPTTIHPAGLMTETDQIFHNGRMVETFPTYARNTSPSSLAGIPGLSLPIGMTVSGLPIGMELDGPALSDRRLLSIGLAIESLVESLPAPIVGE